MPQPHKMVKHTQTIRRQIADELFDHFVGLALKELNGLGIFHMSGSNTFKTSDFADPHFSF